MSENSNGAAAVMRFDRLEFKFLIDDAGRERMLPALLERMSLDPHGDGEGRYRVATTYYDSADRDVYWERVRGVTPRHKLRLRAYGADLPEAGPTFAEIKTRLKRRVVKRRVHLAPDAARALCRGTKPPTHLDPADGLLADDIVRLVGARELRPTMLVRYTRQALAGPEGLRVTFDTDLSYRVGEPTDFGALAMDAALVESGQCIIEIKVPQTVPHWLSVAIAGSGGTLRRFSKYCRALELAELVTSHAPPSFVRSGGRPAFVSGELWTPSTGS